MAAAGEPGDSLAWVQTDSAALATAPVGVVREGRNLRIVRRSDTLQFTDESRDAAWARFTYLRWLPEVRAHLVLAAYLHGEDVGVFWIPADSGDRIVLEDEPVFAPDRRHFFVARLDLDAGYAENSLAVLRAAGGRVDSLLVARGGRLGESANPWGPDSVRWNGSSEVQFVRVEATRQGAIVGRTRMQVQRIGGSWRMSPR